MEQEIKVIKRRLEQKTEQHDRQLERQVQLNSTIQNTENDIQQLEHALHKLEKIEQ